MARTLFLGFVWLSFWLGSPLSSSAARAQTAPEGTDERALARSLFHQGLECLDAGDLQCAAERFTRSQELRESPVVAYNLASVLDRLDQVVRAAELLRWVRRSSDADDQVKAAATTLLATITPRIAYWTLRAEGPLQGVRFHLDGRLLPDQGVGVRAPIDPGEHRVEARRGDQSVASAPFTVAAAGRAEVHLTVPPAPVPTPEEVAEGAAGPEARMITVVRDSPVDYATERRRKRVRRGLGIGAAVAVVAAVVILAVTLHEPDPAQPISGNFGPGVVEVSE